MFLYHVDLIEKASNGIGAFHLGVAQDWIGATDLLQSKVLTGILPAHLHVKPDKPVFPAQDVPYQPANQANLFSQHKTLSASKPGKPVFPARDPISQQTRQTCLPSTRPYQPANQANLFSQHETLSASKPGKPVFPARDPISQQTRQTCLPSTRPYQPAQYNFTWN